MQRFIFIAGLDHSGSTMLDLLLGGHSKMVGLGEIALFLERYPNSIKEKCTCGKIAEECALWNRVITSFHNRDIIPLTDGYKAIIDIFQDQFGSDAILVDSSKYFHVLKHINILPAVDLKVIHLIKDVRNFVISRIDRAKEKQKQYFSPFFTYRQFFLWYRNNKKINNFLREKKIKFMQIGYEEICLHPINSINAICDFLNVPFEHEMLRLINTTSHCLLGNRMRLQKEKKSITYDSRWFIRKEWLIPSFILRKIMIFNGQNVYSQGHFKIYNR